MKINRESRKTAVKAVGSQTVYFRFVPLICFRPVIQFHDTKQNTSNKK